MYSDIKWFNIRKLLFLCISDLLRLQNIYISFEGYKDSNMYLLVFIRHRIYTLDSMNTKHNSISTMFLYLWLGCVIYKYKILLISLKNGSISFQKSTKGLYLFKLYNPKNVLLNTQRKLLRLWSFKSDKTGHTKVLACWLIRKYIYWYWHWTNINCIWMC